MPKTSLLKFKQFPFEVGVNLGPLRNKDNSGFDNLYCDKFIIFGDIIISSLFGDIIIIFGDKFIIFGLVLSSVIWSSSDISFSL